MATEMAPVSSETMATTASDRSLIPRPARWRMPKSLLRFMLSDMGSIHPAATIFPWRTTTAPSCRGALGKKRFFSSSLVTEDWKAVPEEITLARSVSRSKTMRAPTLFLDISP